MPKVSVILIVDNNEELLSRCLDSITNQSLNDIEIICVDNASKDDSYKILSTYSLMDKRIHIVTFEQKQDTNAAINAGINIATGEFISFVKCECCLEKKFYETLYKKDCSFTSTDIYKNNEPKIKKKDSSQSKNNTLIDRILNRNLLEKVTYIRNMRMKNIQSKYIELFQDYISSENEHKTLNIKEFKKNFLNNILSFSKETRLLSISINNSAHILWGIKPDVNKIYTILHTMVTKGDICFAEDAFLRCIVTVANTLPNESKFYQLACGYILDDLTPYYDATRLSRIEQIINSDLIISEEQKTRAKKVINKIVKSKISKYNSQPIFKPDIGRKNVTKILVIDQSYGDYSIAKGCANDKTFKTMLETAIKENPDADILIKTHPDTIGNTIKPKCYYQEIEEKDNIYKITYPINPISIIEYVDKVYVCSSQFGFEALMCGKEVHVFGVPFYAGWGLTKDAQTCSRRTKKRTLEEIFYIAYILMSVYVNPKTDKPCEIEDIIDCLIEMRSQYFTENNILCEL